jgi:hypothetical protein
MHNERGRENATPASQRLNAYLSSASSFGSFCSVVCPSVLGLALTRSGLSVCPQPAILIWCLQKVMPGCLTAHDLRSRSSSAPLLDPFSENRKEMETSGLNLRCPEKISCFSSKNIIRRSGLPCVGHWIGFSGTFRKQNE